MYQSQARRDRSLTFDVARSRAISPAGCRISIWVSSIGTISDALPSAYAAIGSPRLPALTYAEPKAPITVSPTERFHTRRASSNQIEAATTTLTSEATRFAEKI